MLAYLVIREGSKWTDVFRLVPGRSVTIGRAATNQIVIKDDRCSRNHAEVFQVQGRWVLRDLDSRNGTVIGGTRVQGDHPLTAGDVLRIANCQLAFVHDISKAFVDGPGAPTVGEETVSEANPRPFETELIEPTTITHRRHQTRLLRPGDDDTVALPSLGRAAARLCRVAYGMAGRSDVESLADCALEGLLESANLDAGAILVRSRDTRPVTTAKQLEIVGSRSKGDVAYRRVSDFLAATVLREGEAVLARNVADDSVLGGRDSRGIICASGVICAPIRHGKEILGLVHLYSTAAERMPDPDDLEFTLAVADNLGLALDSVGRRRELSEDLSHKREEIAELRHLLGAECEMIGSSAALREAQRDVARAAPTRATVLIRGESGVGKELVARAIHFAGPRKKGPFVCFNCAALTETLLESELFGHERGAFTGATERKIGKFEAADRGTLMLDEIGEMSPSIQAKFLRVLEGHPFERVGGSAPIQADVRVIAATNRDLEAAVADGQFRRDLYFRLHVVEIAVPPLRRRGDDIVELAHHFLKRFNTETGRKIRGFTADAVDHMRRYRWPGNIRELKNAIERAVVLSGGDEIGVADLPFSHLATPGDTNGPERSPDAYQPLSLADVERRHIHETLAATHWNKSRTAAILGIERSTLDRKIRRYKLAPKRA
ncbi:MAG: FHA domain-containing protein [Planctomycetes bacterium]|nr:FHA domain-containing protein [Planctomycetota bacterium]